MCNEAIYVQLSSLIKITCAIDNYEIECKQIMGEKTYYYDNLFGDFVHKRCTTLILTGHTCCYF